jgi:phenylpropionate dioxygenase-like ring-hydroxylating dioxygenase large terminal subunit
MPAREGVDYDSLVKEDRVHISLYTDPAIFSDEMDKIFHRGWVYVGHRGEIPKRGDFRLKRIGLQPVIMVRDQNGQVQLLLNRCRHRGATVCQEGQGNSRSFRCMYHGWTYQLSGELSGVPSMEA